MSTHHQQHWYSVGQKVTGSYIHKNAQILSIWDLLRIWLNFPLSLRLFGVVSEVPSPPKATFWQKPIPLGLDVSLDSDFDDFHRDFTGHSITNPNNPSNLPNTCSFFGFSAKKNQYDRVWFRAGPWCCSKMESSALLLARYYSPSSSSWHDWWRWWCLGCGI